MKKVLLIVFPLLLSSLAAWYFYRPSAIEAEIIVSAVEAPVEEPIEQALGDGDEELGLDEDVAREWDSRRGVKRIVEVPPNEHFGQIDEHRFDDINNIDNNELQAFTDYNLQKALEGDLDAANRVVHARRRCANAPQSPQQVTAQVERQTQRYQWMAQNRDRNRDYPSTAELQDRYRQEYENCRFTDTMFTPNLRQQLEAMANRGHVTARYLYSLWPPEIFGKTDAFLAQQEWAEKALAFTLANLTAGETAGLLAFGQSYANDGMFTARDRYLGTAFIIAALDCGLELDYYASYVDRFLNSERFARNWEDARNQVLIMADGLRGFCS